MGFVQEWFGVDSSIVHVDGKVSCFDIFVKHHIDHGLEGCWGVGQTEEHYLGLEESLGCEECCLPFVLFLDADVVVSPLYIEFCKQSAST